MKKLVGLLVKTAAVVSLTCIVAFAIYGIYWACAYRTPRTAPLQLDMRTASKALNAAGSRSFMICAGLANNPHGYPGHCYIIWDRLTPERLEYADSDGFVPAGYAELIPSMYTDVQGIMADKALMGNMRNFDYIGVRVEESKYKQLRAVRARFVEDTTFHTGVRDCVAYVNEIAQIAGLKTPKREFVYPLDYLELLKKLNSNANS